MQEGSGLVAPKSLVVRVPAEPEHQVLEDKLWMIHWAVLGCQCTPGLLSQQRRCKRGHMSSFH